MSTLKLDGITKKYSSKNILENISLKINSGEFIVVVGSSGCGKSTLLRIISGLDEATSGNIYIDDKNIGQLEPKDRDISMVFQNYALYPHMTVYDNIAYSLKVRKIPKNDIKKKVEKIGSLLQIEHLLDRKPSALSGGQRQRVAMGRAIIRNPKIFLFDEPLSNLDAKLRVDMRLEIKKLQSELNTTSIYVTHDQVEAMTMADRIIILNNGKIEQFDTPKRVYQKPATKFVAEFIGSPNMNFMDANITEHGLPLLPNLTLNVKLKSNNKNNMPVIVGIRPEHIELCSSTIDSIKVNIEAIENLGSETILYSKVYNCDTRLTIKYKGYWPGSIGDRVNIKIPEDHIHIFDRITQNRMDIVSEKNNLCLA